MREAARLSSVVVLLALMLTACTESATPNVSGTASGPKTPAGVQQRQALTQARSAFENYLRVSAELLRARRAEEDSLLPYLTEAAARDEIRSIGSLTADGLHLRGQSLLRDFRLQRFDARTLRLTAYACVDLTGARVIDRHGRDVTPKNRADLQTSLPSFVYEDTRMKLEKDGIWSGKSIC